MAHGFDIVVIAVALLAVVVAVALAVAARDPYAQVGESVLDTDADAGPAPEPTLRDEVRELVEARNARRAARGQEPLDVDAEVERRLRALGGG